TEGPGKRALGLGAPRDGILQLPPVVPATPMPLVVLLHGAGGSADGVMRRVGSAPAAAGVAVLAPDSRDATWDAIRAGFYGDVAFLDKALEKVFERAAGEPRRSPV